MFWPGNAAHNIYEVSDFRTPFSSCTQNQVHFCPLYGVKWATPSQQGSLLWEGQGRGDVCRTQPYFALQRGCFHDLNPLHFGHKGTTFPLRQISWKSFPFVQLATTFQMLKLKLRVTNSTHKSIITENNRISSTKFEIQASVSEKKSTKITQTKTKEVRFYRKNLVNENRNRDNLWKNKHKSENKIHTAYAGSPVVEEMNNPTIRFRSVVGKVKNDES